MTGRTSRFDRWGSGVVALAAVLLPRAARAQIDCGAPTRGHPINHRTDCACNAGFERVQRGRLRVCEAISVTPIGASPTVLASGSPAGSIRWVVVPEGSFRWAEAPTLAEVHVRSFEMMESAATVAQYASCVDAGRCTPPNAGAYCNGRRADRADHPINCIDWAQASAFCEWASGRLPTEAEREFAARGTTARTYPWGSTGPRDQLCWSGIRRRAHTCPVASFSSGRSPFGLFDLAGNVWEWTADPWSASPGGAVAGALRRVVRGGCWSNDLAEVLRIGVRFGVDPMDRYDDLGARCVRGG